MRNFVFLFSTFILVSCSQKEKMGEVETIVCDFDSSTPLYQCEWIENISFTPLDNSCLIGAEAAIRITGDNLFVQHGSWSDISIDRFNMNGQYLNRIGRHGRGPGEYGVLSDWFLYENNLIGVHTYGSQTIMLYQYGGCFVREIDYQLSPGSFLLHSQGPNFWAFMRPETGLPRLVYLSESGAVLKSMLPSEKTYQAAADLWRIFYKTNERLYIGMPYNNTIYLAQNDTVYPAFLINAGKYSIPEDFYNDPFAAWLFLGQKGYASVYNFLESKEYFVIQMVIRQTEFEGIVWGIKNKRSKKWFWSNMERWPTSEEVSDFYKLADITDDNRLFILIPPYELKEQLLFMKNASNPHKLGDLDDNDNSVLVEIKLK